MSKGRSNSARKRNDTVTDNEVKIKLVLLGDISVGKTALATRFAKGTFGDEYRPTIGASFISKAVQIHDEVIMFQIWDTAGQERYQSLVPMYLRGASVAILVYDVTDKESFKNVSNWLKHLRTHVGEIPIALVGNKIDLDIVVEQEAAQNYAIENKLIFFQVSAKSGENVDRLFRAIGIRGAEAKKRDEAAEMKVETRARKTPSTKRPVTVVLDDEDDDPAKNTKCCKS